MTPSTSTVGADSTFACPNCRQPMRAQDLEHIYRGTVRVELCFACAGIWFDHMASMQLAPAAVLELLKEIHSNRDVARQAYSDHLNCPRCNDPLTLSFDLSKAGRFSYFRCRRDEGRFTPFIQFLREKQFVRSLTTVELQRVRAQVRQVTCSQCGAPIDLEHTSECQYCHAPVSFLDPEAVNKAMSMWTEAAQRRQAGLNSLALTESLQHHATTSADAPLGGLLLAGAIGAGVGIDLVAMGIHAIGSLFAASEGTGSQ